MDLGICVCDGREMKGLMKAGVRSLRKTDCYVHDDSIIRKINAVNDFVLLLPVDDFLKLPNLSEHLKQNELLLLSYHNTIQELRKENANLKSKLNALY